MAGNQKKKNPLSNAERQRRFRARRDENPEKRQKYLDYEHERYMKEKANGRRKSISQLTPREQRVRRRTWRNQKRKVKDKNKVLEEAMLSPPLSPISDQERPLLHSRQKAQGSKNKNKLKARCYRENHTLRLKLEQAERQAELYRKRWQREAGKTADKDTPRKKTRRLLRNVSKKSARKALLFNTALMVQLQKWYKEKSSARKKDISAMLCHGEILKKYKFRSYAKATLGIMVRTKSGGNYSSISYRECKQVQEFYERDDNSRLMTGIKNTVTFKKEKKQRRVTLHTLKSLHLKYGAEHQSTIGFCTFCRLRPFWVVFQRASDRETCACKLCSNIQLMATGLKSSNAIKSDNLDDLLSEVVCNITSQECMFGQCNKCNDRRITYDRDNGNNLMTWSQFKTQTVKRKIKVGQSYVEKEIKVTGQDPQTDSIHDVVHQLEKDMERYRRHVFIIKSQFAFFRRKKTTMEDNECVLHIDFSEDLMRSGYSKLDRKTFQFFILRMLPKYLSQAFEIIIKSDRSSFL